MSQHSKARKKSYIRGQIFESNTGSPWACHKCIDSHECIWIEILVHLNTFRVFRQTRSISYLIHTYFFLFFASTEMICELFTLLFISHQILTDEIYPQWPSWPAAGLLAPVGKVQPPWSTKSHRGASRRNTPDFGSHRWDTGLSEPQEKHRPENEKRMFAEVGGLHAICRGVILKCEQNELVTCVHLRPKLKLTVFRKLQAMV